DPAARITSSSFFNLDVQVPSEGADCLNIQYTGGPVSGLTFCGMADQTSPLRVNVTGVKPNASYTEFKATLAAASPALSDASHSTTYSAPSTVIGYTKPAAPFSGTFNMTGTATTIKAQMVLGSNNPTGTNNYIETWPATQLSDCDTDPAANQTFCI